MKPTFDTLPHRCFRLHRWLLLPALISLTLATGGCPGPAARQAAVAPQGLPVVFEDVTHAAGLDFVHQTGARGDRWLPETMGSGCAFVDLNNNGHLDIILVDATGWPGGPGSGGRSRVYLNNGDGRFEDATDAWGMPEGLYGMGIACADYDNDGFTDVLITALGESRLLRNVDGRRFEDVSAGSGIHTPGWPTSAAWIDYNRDGWVDLFVCNYVEWTPETDLFVSLDGVNKSYARPDQYAGSACMLFENRAGRFVDVSAAAGIDRPNAKALGVALCDFDRDGWVDVVVSNDMVPNFLFHNQGNGTFKEVAVQAGVAVTEAGTAKAGMGIDVADYENTGQDGILITNFSGEQLSLFRRDGSGLFMDVAARSGIGTPSQRFLGFGTFFFDADLDGTLDIFVANGHIQDDIGVRSSAVSYAQPALLLRGEGDGAFRDISATAGALNVPRVGRGAAYGDFDNDGDLDVLLTTSGGAAVLLRQAGRPSHNWLRLVLEGRESNRSAIGAMVRVRSGELVQSRMVRSGSSYLSQSSLRLTFGLGQRERIDDIEVRWPNGTIESFGSVELNREYRLVESTARAVASP
jgi:enediyne biosynthesis protein E4